MAQARRVVSIAAAGLLVGSALVVSAHGEGDAAASAPPPIGSRRAWEGPAGGDGHTRFVVTPAGLVAPDALSIRTDDGGVEPELALRRADGSVPRLDAAALADAHDAIGPDGELVLVDDVLTWRTASGDRVVDADHGRGGSDGVTTAASPDELAGELEALDDVASAQVLRDGTLLVATTLTAEELAAVDGVGGVRPTDEVAVLASPPNDPLWAYHWHLENSGWADQQAAAVDADIDGFDGWDASLGAGQVIAVIDTGYAPSQEDLLGSLWSNPGESCGSGVDADGNGKPGDCAGWNFYANTHDIANGAGGWHGSAVGGTAVARMGNGRGMAGVAPAAQVMPLVVGSGTSITMQLAIEAIYYAVDQGATVINASFGGSLSPASVTALTAAVQYAYERDVLVVAAAGNDALNRDLQPRYPASLDHPGVITVGASNAVDGIADFSATGPTTVDLFAPGNQVIAPSNDGLYYLWNGTSLSSPYVAAAVALLRSTNPGLDADAQRAALLANVEPLPALTGASVTGGRLSLSRLFANATTVDVRYEGLDGLRSDRPVAPNVVFSAAPDGSHTLDVQVATRYAGEVWAVADLTVQVGSTVRTTDDDGRASFPAPSGSGPVAVRVEMSLPAGEYALVSGLRTDGDLTMGEHAASFVVSDPVAPTTSTTAASGTTTTAPGSPSPTTSTTAWWATTTTAPATGPTPTTAPPAPSDPSEPITHPTLPGGSTSTTAPSGGPTPTTAPGVTPTTAPSGGTTPTTASGATTTTAPPGGSSPTTQPATTSTTSPPASSTVSPTGRDGDATRYPGTDVFGVTRISPSSVDVGDTVTLLGADLPTAAYVLIGARPATVLTSPGPGQLSVRVPTLVSGRYDVVVSDRDSSRQVTYLDAVDVAGAAPTPTSTTLAEPTSTTAGAGPGPTSTTAVPSPTPTTAPGAPPTPTTTAAPATSTTAAPAPAPTASTTTTVAGPRERTGPGGLRLVSSSSVDALSPALWTQRCATASCPAVGVTR